MSILDDLFEAIVAHPDDDRPRHIYADALLQAGQPDRAQFVQAQLRAHQAFPPSRGARARFVSGTLGMPEISQEQSTSWFGALPATTLFERGFPVAAQIDLRDHSGDGSALKAPGYRTLRALRMRSTTALGSLLRDPALGNLQHLDNLWLDDLPVLSDASFRLRSVSVERPSDCPLPRLLEVVSDLDVPCVRTDWFSEQDQVAELRDARVDTLQLEPSRTWPDLQELLASFPDGVRRIEVGQVGRGVVLQRDPTTGRPQPRLQNLHWALFRDGFGVDLAHLAHVAPLGVPGEVDHDVWYVATDPALASYAERLPPAPLRLSRSHEPPPSQAPSALQELQFIASSFSLGPDIGWVERSPSIERLRIVSQTILGDKFMMSPSGPGSLLLKRGASGHFEHGVLDGAVDDQVGPHLRRVPHLRTLQVQGRFAERWLEACAKWAPEVPVETP